MMIITFDPSFSAPITNTLNHIASKSHETELDHQVNKRCNRDDRGD